MKISKSIILTGLLVVMGILSFEIYTIEQEKRLVKEDLIELSKIKYGLFSVDEWKRILAGIITKKIEEFNFQGANRAQMRKEISAFLYKQIGDFEVRFHEENSQTFAGMFQNGIASITGLFGKVKRDIPMFTDRIIDFMNDPRNRKAVKAYIIKKLNTYADKTFSKTDYTTHDQIINKYKFENQEAALSGLANRIESLDNQSRPFTISLLIAAVALGMYIILSKQLTQNESVIIILICFSLLVTGLLLPMIEIDARISTISFSLLGESVSFKDQVLYYKSKSILEVVKLMITQSRFDLLFVGFLVLTFSVLFPLSKLISSVMYLYSDHLKSNRVIQFMVFKTGKWSMADVMVIAIFMAYMGFSGIITEQLKQIESIALNIDILTTNKSSLQAGFFLFTSFSVLSLLFSYKLQYQNRRPNETSDQS